MDVRSMIHALGGPTVVSRRLGKVGVQAVSNWGHRDRVPPEHANAVWRLCAQAGVAWRPEGTEGLQLAPTEAA